MVRRHLLGFKATSHIGEPQTEFVCASNIYLASMLFLLEPQNNVARKLQLLNDNYLFCASIPMSGTSAAPRGAEHNVYGPPTHSKNRAQPISFADDQYNVVMKRNRSDTPSCGHCGGGSHSRWGSTKNAHNHFDVCAMLCIKRRQTQHTF